MAALAALDLSDGRARVHLLRATRFDAELHTFVRTGYGFRAECPCAWRGDRQATWREARRELREHLESVHGGNPTKGGNG